MGLLWLSTEWQGLGQSSVFPNSPGHPDTLAPNPPTTTTAVRQMVTGLAPAARHPVAEAECLAPPPPVHPQVQPQGRGSEDRARHLQWELSWPASNPEAGGDENVRTAVNTCQRGKLTAETGARPSPDSLAAFLLPSKPSRARAAQIPHHPGHAVVTRQSGAGGGEGTSPLPPTPETVGCV